MVLLTNLQKTIQGRTVLDIPMLKVEAGEVVAVVGPAGSGQDELVALLTGKLQPTLGQVQVAGMDPHAERERYSQRVGVLFDEDGLYERQTVLENLAFYSRLYGLPTARTQAVLACVGLGDHSAVRIGKLPSGLRRRLAFGRAILHSPSVLLLVEPFARCDQASISLLHNLVQQLAQEGSAVLIFASDTANLATLCKRIYTLVQGQLQENLPLPAVPEAATPYQVKVPVRLEGKVALIDLGDILYAEVEAGRAYLQTRSERLPTQFTLTELEERLVRGGFFRAHRGYLVNLQHVKEVIPYTRDSFSLRLDDPAGTVIPLSKSAANELKDLLGY